MRKFLDDKGHLYVVQNKHYVVVFQKYNIQENFSSLTEAVKFRDKMLEKVASDIVDNVDIDIKKVYPANILNIVYGAANSKEMRCLDYDYIEHNFEDNLEIIMEQCFTEKERDSFIRHYKLYQNTAKISVDYNVTRQAIHAEIQSAMRKVILRRGILFYGRSKMNYESEKDKYERLSLEYQTKQKTLLDATKTAHIETTYPIVVGELEGLGTRALNVLNDNKIRTVSQLIKLTENDLRRFRNAGDLTVRQIKIALAKAGLKLKIKGEQNK